jgi:MFS family permease
MTISGSAGAGAARAHGAESEGATPIRTVVVASSTGTAFEWYDFFVFGTLAAIISRNFFADLDPTAGLVASLALFAAGFLFRPIGALVFGRLGDRFGRKGAFLATVILMGGATFAIGLLPTYDQIGPLSAVLLLILRICQGLAVGGEYGGAVIYVAEHSEPHRRGEHTGWIQSSAAFGLLGALGVVLLTRTTLGEEAFVEWGWRIPFLVSAGLLAISIWMRLRLKESPEFQSLKAQGLVSEKPYAETFLRWENLKVVLTALVCLMLAQGAIWWATFFFTQIFLESFMKLDPVRVNTLLIAATIVSIPLYVFFGWLSDRVGRKPVLLFGIVLAAVAIFPSFHTLARGANPELMAAQARTPVVVVADPADCSFQFDVLGRARFETSCDIARNVLTRSGVSYHTEAAPAGAVASIRIGDLVVASQSAAGLPDDAFAATRGEVELRVREALTAAGFPERADPEQVNWLMLALGLAAVVIGATALYGPMPAALVEMMPTRIRYTALSVPYHVGVGWVGGFMPMTAFAMATAAGDIFAGLWYTVVFASISAVCCLVLFRETKGRPLRHFGTEEAAPVAA